MKKLLVFTKNTFCIERCSFSLPGLEHDNTYVPILINRNGITDTIDDADLIILPDENIFTGQNYIVSKNLLLNLLEIENLKLYVVFHRLGRFLQVLKDVNNETIKNKLMIHHNINQSHTRDGFYYNELKAIVKAISEKDNISYNNAIEATKNRFPDTILEAKLNLLHKLFVPPETQELDEFFEWEDLTSRVSIEEKHKYEDTWEGFKKEKSFFIIDFIEKYIRSEKQPVKDYFSKLEKIRDVLLV